LELKRDFKIITRHDRRILRDLLPLKKPLSVFIEPTNMCNFRCTPCVHGQEKTRNDLKPFAHMDIDLFKKVIGEIKRWDGDKLRLLRLAVLGEPLLHPQMTDMIRIAKEAEVAERVDTFTNGSLLTENISKKIVQYKLDYIRFSIYSVLNDRHKEVTQSNYDINKIYNNIKNLRRIRDYYNSAKPYILVKMFDTYSKENDVFLGMYKDVADEVGFEKVHDATKYSGYDLIKSYYKNEKNEEMTRSHYQKGLNNHIACPRPFMALVVNNIGDVLMCTHDAPKATRVGNVKNNSLEEIWNGQELYKFRKMQLLGHQHENILCRNCDWYKLFPAEDNVDGFPLEKLIPEGAGFCDSLHQTKGS
jgi:radical SAM protein with 4Fe4S-binding SPASM domain